MTLCRLNIFQGEFVDGKILKSRTETRIDARGVLELTVRGNQIALSRQSDPQQIAGLKVLRFGFEKLFEENDSLVPLAFPNQRLGLGVGLGGRGNSDR